MFNNISEHQVVQGVEIITNMIAEKVCSVATTYIKKLQMLTSKRISKKLRSRGCTKKN